MTHELPPLPYERDALRPFLSPETLDYHYGKHHQAYVTKLNAGIKGTPFENSSLEEIIEKASGGLFNNAAQVWNHTFYWNGMSPKKQEPRENTANALEKHWGSVENFKNEFKNSAAANFGSGWTWLTQKASGELSILNTDDADTPVKHQQKAILTLDVWEHAYYIDYRNERPKYIDAFWDAVNWDFVEKNLS